MRLLLSLGVTWLLIAAMPAGAATFNVDRTDDVVASGCSDGVPNDCSLRGAIIAANSNPGADIINLPAGTYVLTIAGRCEDAAATGDLDITDALTIVGAGAPTTIIDANGIDRVFDVAADLTVQGVAIRNGDARTMSCISSGGGIFSAPAPPTTTAVQLTLNDVTITQNKASEGGGIDSEVGSTLSLNGVTLSGNSADLAGGGVQNLASPGGATLTNVTLSGNSASSGAGIHNEGDLTLTSVTMSGNTWDDANIGGCTIRDTIIAGSPSNQNCTGSRTILAEDHNLDSGNTCGFVDPSDLTDTDPRLGPLQDNGGPTLTHALLPGSPAIDGGSPSCPPPATDQRGTSRPQPPGGPCDIGAYELVPGTGSTSTTTPTLTVTTTTAPCTSARCVLDAGLTSPVCAAETIPPGVTRKFDRALHFIDQSATRSGKKATQLLKRAKRALNQAKGKITRAARGKKAKISAQCAAALKAAADQAASGLGV